jgi:hypothetical protein
MVGKDKPPILGLIQPGGQVVLSVLPKCRDGMNCDPGLRYRRQPLRDTPDDTRYLRLDAGSPSTIQWRKRGMWPFDGQCRVRMGKFSSGIAFG